MINWAKSLFTKQKETNEEVGVSEIPVEWEYRTCVAMRIMREDCYKRLPAASGTVETIKAATEGFNNIFFTNIKISGADIYDGVIFFSVCEKDKNYRDFFELVITYFKTPGTRLEFIKGLED